VSTTAFVHSREANFQEDSVELNTLNLCLGSSKSKSETTLGTRAKVSGADPRPKTTLVTEKRMLIIAGVWFYLSIAAVGTAETVA
jgi:hypothetical protein